MSAGTAEPDGGQVPRDDRASRLCRVRDLA